MDSDAFSSKFGELGKSVILLFLQGFSLATTVEGAKIIAEDLPVIPIVNIPTYLLLGMGIQLMIFWLLVFGKKGGIKSPTILWMLIIILTFCSIYTSFFSLYKGLSGKDLNATTIAIEQSDRITTEIFNSSKYTEESKDYPSRQQEFDKEDTTWNRTCITGINIPECQNVKEKLNAANKNLKPLLRVKRLEEYTKKLKTIKKISKPMIKIKTIVRRKNVILKVCKH
jgi:hypothetical protein